MLSTAANSGYSVSVCGLKDGKKRVGRQEIGKKDEKSQINVIRIAEEMMEIQIPRPCPNPSESSSLEVGLRTWPFS